MTTSINKTQQHKILLGFPESIHHAEELALLMNIPCAEIKLHYFPDGECKVTLPVELLRQAKHVFIYRSLNFPNNKLIELILAVQGCRELGVEQLSLVAPYMCYMRQDKAFQPGEVVSQTVIGKLLANYFDTVVTVDSHLHRVSKLSEAIPTTRAINLSATKPIATFLKQQLKFPLLLGPDEESLQWVKSIAEQGKFDYAFATKKRLGDREVKISLPDMNFHGREIVLVDDMASSGKTLIETTRQLMSYEPASISVFVTHALFMDDSIQELHAAGVTNIWSCNSVIHASNAVSLASVLAEHL